jgi:uncharacterized membrane protein YdjX (TVP38/TMEM64 family)
MLKGKSSKDARDSMTKPSTSAEPARTEARPAWRRYLPLILLAAAMAGAYAAGLHRYLSFDAIIEHRDWLKQAVKANKALALLAYLGVYAACVALSLPGAVLLTLLGGFLFGGVLGGIAAVLAATAGAIVVFLVARSAFGEALQRKAGPALARILEGFKSEAASYLLFLRLVPAFPFWLVNLAAAIGGVKLPVFAWTTLVGIIPGTLAFAVAGAGLDSVIAAQGEARTACQAAGRADCAGGLDLKAIVTPELLIAFGLLGCVALIPVIWRRISKRRQADQGGRI